MEGDRRRQRETTGYDMRQQEKVGDRRRQLETTGDM
jgi:hypothetical protein